MVSITGIQTTGIDAKFSTPAAGQAAYQAPEAPAYTSDLSQAAQSRATALPDVAPGDMDEAWAENARSVIASQISAQSGLAASLHSGLDPARVAKLLGLD